MLVVLCSFCGLGPPRRERFINGLAGYAICANCVQLMTSMQRGQFPPPGVRRLRGRKAATRRLEGEEAERARQIFADIVCRFCGRRRAEFGSGGVAGSTPATFICPDCIRRAEAELLAG
jgi:hypothetical protein